MAKTEKNVSGKVVNASKEPQKAAVKKPAKAPATKVAKATVKKSAEAMTPEARFKLIEQTAYFKAERDQFLCDPSVYWVEAEHEIAATHPHG